MAYTVRLSDLGAMSATERTKVLQRLADEAASPPNGQADAALARVRQFEQRYEFSSEELLKKLSSGDQRETAEIAEWLFCLKLLSIGR